MEGNWVKGTWTLLVRAWHLPTADITIFTSLCGTINTSSDPWLTFMAFRRLTVHARQLYTNWSCVFMKSWAMGSKYNALVLSSSQDYKHSSINSIVDFPKSALVDHRDQYLATRIDCQQHGYAGPPARLTLTSIIPPG